MNRTILWGAAASILAVTLAMKVTERTGKQLQTFAETFRETLDDQQRSLAFKAFDDASRMDWHFNARENRKGLPISSMNDAQSTAALRLVRAAMSEIGYRKVNQIRLLESVVADLEGPERLRARDPAAYYVTIFGRPKSNGSWGLSFEGHHVSLNLVCRDGKVVDSTPQFLGTNPSVVPDDYKGVLPVGSRVLADEEDLGFKLLKLMTPEMLAKAVIASEAPKETRFAGEPQTRVDPTPQGVSYREMTTAQQQLLTRLIHLYTDAAADEIAQSRLSRIDTDGWENIHFAWMGATRPGVGHSYRVRGNSFLIELVNSQPDARGNPANHLHCVLRDLTGDFDLPLQTPQ